MFSPSKYETPAKSASGVSKYVIYFHPPDLKKKKTERKGDFMPLIGQAKLLPSDCGGGSAYKIHTDQEGTAGQEAAPSKASSCAQAPRRGKASLNHPTRCGIKAIGTSGPQRRESSKVFCFKELSGGSVAPLPNFNMRRPRSSCKGLYCLTALICLSAYHI